MTEEATEISTELEVIAPSALEAIERANVDIQITTARKYPRRLTIVKQRMMNLATLDEETAASCFYRLNRQGKQIEGPSIRLAEIAASSYGNLRYGARVVANDGKVITAQGFCHDLETNVLSTIEVQRRITGRDGKTYSEDMQVVTGNAACAIAARNSIFKVVPFAFVKPIFLAAKQTAVGDITTLAERRTKMVDRFAALGVNQKRICESLGKSGMEEIGLGELEILIGLHNAIRDGDQTVEEAFPTPKAASEGIQFGPANGIATETTVFPDGDTINVHTHQNSEPDMGPQKRKRRTKAEMAVARGEAPEPAEQQAKPEPPPRATPLEGLTNLINGSPFTEESFVRHLIVTARIEPHQKLVHLPEDMILRLQSEFMTLASEILDPANGSVAAPDQSQAPH